MNFTFTYHIFIKIECNHCKFRRCFIKTEHTGIHPYLGLTGFVWAGKKLNLYRSIFNSNHMNLFILYPEPKAAAQAHADKHVVKMILEACQMLYTAHWTAAHRELIHKKKRCRCLPVWRQRLVRRIRRRGDICPHISITHVQSGFVYLLIIICSPVNSQSHLERSIPFATEKSIAVWRMRSGSRRILLP